MKFINWYTISLIIIACLAFFYSCIAMDPSDINIFIVMTVIVIILEIIPIRLPSGDQYAAGSIGFLFLLIHSGFPYAVLAIYCATLAYYLKSLRRGKIPPIRLFVTIGMYVLSVFSALIVWEFSNELNVFLGITLVAIVFEVVNFVILEGLGATVFNKKMFANIKPKLVEVMITAFISTVVISRLIIIETDLDLIVSMIYTLFFLLILIYFSYEFTKQLSLRKSTSSAFIQVLEGRIAHNLAGHGNRVGIICDNILEDIGYPKKKRNDLVQASIIHDIGKALIPSSIFRKRGNLTLSEEREYKSHPEKAVEFVKVMFPKETFSNWILYHHERWDGKGFPKGLKEEEIPLESRIIALANELDHIISRQKDPETILKIFKERSGTLLDPKLVAKVNLQHIEMMIEDTHSLLCPEELSQENQITESQSSFNNPYSSLGNSFFIQMKNGQVISTKAELPDEFLQSMSNAAIERQDLVHETFIYNNVSLDLYAEPLRNGEISIFAHDITPYLDYRKKLEQSILESYVEIIQTLSNGKIKLHSIKSNLVNQLGEIIKDIDINKNSDVPKSRELIKEILVQNPTEIESMRVQLAVTEAVTNILKHATGGNLSVYRINHMLQFFISDKGSGIPLHEIPKTILVSGYSSKRSLGQGFKMISSFSDGAQIYTSQEGTCVLIEYKLRI